ncbi:hypothetical protein Tco_0603416 [Tanacetum coccineum]
MSDLEFDDESIDRPLVSPVIDLDEELDDGEVLNELNEYGNAGNFYHNNIINNIDGDDLAFPCMIGFRKFVAYFDPLLPMNIITRKAYNTIMVEGLESIGRILVSIVRDVYVFVGSFTYVTDCVVLEDIREFIISDMSEVVMGRPFKSGACVFTDRWSLDELAYGVPSEGPYQTNPHSPDDIISFIRTDREGQVTRIRHEQEIDVQDHQTLTCEIVSTLKPLEEIIRENVFCLGFIMNENPELFKESYVLYDRVMNPLTTQQERKTRKDHGTRRGRHSTSSSSAFDQPSSSHLNDDDDGNGEGTSRASTPSPIRFVNSLTNDVPQVFQNPPNINSHMELFYTRQTEIINRLVRLRDEHRGGLRSIEKGLRNL